jgi:hypothetical protein
LKLTNKIQTNNPINGIDQTDCLSQSVESCEVAHPTINNIKAAHCKLLNILFITILNKIPTGKKTCTKKSEIQTK